MLCTGDHFGGKRLEQHIAIADIERPQSLGEQPTRISVSDNAYDAFVRRLEEPPQPNEELERLMARTDPWERNRRYIETKTL